VDLLGADLRYLQISRRLEADITTGRLAPGQRLAPERELGERLGVARNTLRRALAGLEARGLVESRGRVGWVVTTKAVTERLDRPHGLTEWAAQEGLDVSSRVLRARSRPIDRDEAARLRLPLGELAFELERVRLIDGVPLSLDRAVIHPRLLAAVEGVDFSAASLYATLHDRAGVVPSRTDVVLRAVSATARVAPLLGVNVSAPLLELTETAYDQYDEPFEASTLLNRGDRYIFGATLLASVGLTTVEPSGSASRQAMATTLRRRSAAASD